MKPRATLILVGVAAALGAGYWYWEVKSKPAREQAKEDAKRVFPDMSAASTGEVLIRKDKDPEVLLRRVHDEWRLIKPVQAPADASAVDELLKQLGQVKRAEVVEDQAKDLRKYGLDQPSGAVTFLSQSQSAKSQVLFFGADSFDGTQAYAMVNGKPDVFLTAIGGRSAILKNAADLRDKKLANFEESQVVSIRSTLGGGLLLDKDAKGQWRVKAGGRTEPGDPAKVSAWIEQLRTLKGDVVVEEKASNPGRYGIGSARVEVDFGGGQHQGFLKGKLKDKGPAFYLQMIGMPQVWSMPASAETVLSQAGKPLMDLRAFDIQAGNIERVDFWSQGVTQTARRKKDLTWAWDKEPTLDPGEKPLDLPEFVATVAGTERMKTLRAEDKPAHPMAMVSFYAGSENAAEVAWVSSRRDGGQMVFSGRKGITSIIPGNVFLKLPRLPKSPGK